MKPWDRRDGEPDTAYAAFEVFLHLTRRVTVDSTQFSELVMAEKGVSLAPSTLRGYQSEHKWRDRKRAYQSWLLTKKLTGVADSLTKEAATIAKKHTKLRRIVATKAAQAAERIDLFTDDADARQFNAYLDALQKILNLGCLADLDHADQLRRLSTKINAARRTEPSDSDSDELPEIPDGAGEIQPGSPETAGLLGETASDLQGRSGSEDPHGSSPIG